MIMNVFWQDVVIMFKFFFFRCYYVSFFVCCFEICKFLFEGIELFFGQEKLFFKFIIKELFRERLYFYMCDCCCNGIWIRENFFEFEFEEGFVDEDVYWKMEGREMFQEYVVCMMVLFEDVFEYDDEQIISFLIYLGMIVVLIKVMGYEDFFVELGNVVLFLIKGEIIQFN